MNEIYAMRHHHDVELDLYAIAIGVVASIGGFLFRKGIDLIDYWLFSEENQNRFLRYVQQHELFRGMTVIAIVLLPAIGGLIVGYGVWKISPEAKGHGIPNVLQSMIIDKGNMRMRVPMAKFVLSMITIGTGNSAGSEGPIAQIGAGFGSILGQKARLTSSEKNILIATGAASGIAAVFNAPLGGALFGIEILLASITFRSVIPVIIGVSSAMTTNYVILGGFESVFQVPPYEIHHPVEFILFVILGVVIAFEGVIWQETLKFTEDTFEQLSLPPWAKPGIGGLGVGIFLVTVSLELRGSSYSVIQKALNGWNYSSDIARSEALKLIFLLLAYAFIKIIITSLTLGSGSSGGVFSPSLFMGALTGAAFGIFLSLLFPGLHINPGLYAVLGMSALFGSVARAPLTMIIITTEMSGEYALFPALMLTIATSFLIHKSILKESIYTEPLAGKYGITSQVRTTDEILQFILVREVMHNEVVAIYEDTPASVMFDVFVSYHHQGYPVVDRETHQLVGIVTLSDIRKAIIANDLEQPIKRIMTKEVVVAFPDDTVKETLDKMYRYGVGRLPVVIPNPESEQYLLVGMFTRSDLVKTLESYQVLIAKDHDQALTNIKEKIDMNLVEVIPSRYPHLKKYVVHIAYDWIGAYQQIICESGTKNSESST